MKPDNFLLGLGPLGQTLHIIDFGLSKMYRNPKTQQHVSFADGKNLTGTARFASLNAHTME